MSTSLAEQIISRNGAMKGEASNWRTNWQDSADYIMPRRGQITTQNAQGETQTTQLFDTTAGEANLVFAAGLLSQLTPPGEMWARVESAAKEPSEEVNRWFDGESQGVMEDIHASNFYLAIHEAFLALGAFCTSDVYLEEGTKRFFLNFCNVPVGTFTIAEDSEGFVDTVFKEWQWTARQAEQKWGRDKLGPMLTKALASPDAKEADKKFTFIHAIYPRRSEDTKDGQVEGKLRPIASVYVCVEDKTVIDEGGYYEMPHGCCRLLGSNNELYGRGPGLDIMPEIKLVNRMEYDLLLALEKAVNPSWLAPEDAAYRPDNRPNGVTYWDTSNPANKPEVVENKARIDLGEQKTEQKRERIRRAFFVDMFQMLNRPEVLKNEKTAFQIAEMLQEKLLLFAPFFSRITHELLSVLLQRAFVMRIREGRSAPPPPEMGNAIDYKITYTSKIALAIRAAQDNSTLDMLQACSLMAPFDQRIPLIIDWGKRFREMARNRGIPSEDVRTEEAVDEMMAQMQQAEAAMQQAEMAEKTTAAVKNMGPKAQEIATNSIAKFKE